MRIFPFAALGLRLQNEQMIDFLNHYRYPSLFSKRNAFDERLRAAP
jgi:hypothetical protein